MNKILKAIQKFLYPNAPTEYDPSINHEFCPRCEANLTLQKGYDNALPYWVCKGCGEMLINPSLDTDSDIIWRCDHCEDLLNIQPGFTEDCGIWKCANCGYENRIDASEVYDSEDELRVELENPYRGLSDDAILQLSCYEEVAPLGGRENVFLIRDRESGETYVRKILKTYDESIYRFLKDHPVAHMPKIRNFFEGADSLIVIEEYIPGTTLEHTPEQGHFPREEAIRIVIRICRILDELHHLEPPMVHRDVKPSNIILAEDGEVWLLDVNVAKWHDPEETRDTRYMGTENYAAPEQVGYGMKASSPKTDIYAVGMLLNVMLTGAFPKDKPVEGPLGNVIQKCISLNAEERYTAAELGEVLEECPKGNEYYGT